MEYILKKINKKKRFNPDDSQDLGIPESLYETYEEELMQPLTVSVNEIALDMKNYAENFPFELIPHITDLNEVNDIIHNYKGST